MKKLQLLALLLICSVTITIAQKPKFKKVSKEELEKTICSYDESANAEFLYHGCSVQFEYDESRGDFDVKYYYHDRIKIYNEDGMDLADQIIRFYKVRNGTKSERVIDLEAYTFNMEGGEVVKKKLQKKDIFEEELSKNYSAVKFAMPAIKAGSVLEIKYTLVSPYYFRMDEFYFQKDVPIKYTEYKASTPEYYNYNFNVKGLVDLKVEEDKGQGRINYTTTSNSSTHIQVRKNTQFRTLTFTKNIRIYSASDVASLKKEPFVYSMNNFKSSIRLELLFTQFPGSGVKYYTKTWDDIAKLLESSDNFGGQLNKNYKAMDELINEVKDLSPKEKIATIYAQVQNQFTWNSESSLYTDKGIKNLLKEGTGNSAEINLLLVNLLNKAGLQSYPMVYRTRKSGNLNISNPSLADLNYVVAIVVTEKDIIYLDATNKSLQVDMLPSRALNLKGVVVMGDKAQEVPIQNHNKGNESKVYTLKIEGDKLVGTYKQKSKGYDAYFHRSKYNESKDLISNLQGDKSSFLNTEVKDFTNCAKPISIESDITLEGHTQSFDGKIFIDLLVGEEDFKNPFESETREFALFFNSKSSQTKMVKIEIPEGYQVESIPEAMNMATPNKYVKYMLKPQVVGNEIVITIRSSVNETIISPEYYEALKLLNDNVEKTSNEKIVLAKI